MLRDLATKGFNGTVIPASSVHHAFSGAGKAAAVFSLSDYAEGANGPSIMAYDNAVTIIQSGNEVVKNLSSSGSFDPLFLLYGLSWAGIVGIVFVGIFLYVRSAQYMRGSFTNFKVIRLLSILFASCIILVFAFPLFMCVRHTSADAYQLGYDVVVAKDATNSFTKEDYESGLAYLHVALQRCYRRWRPLWRPDRNRACGVRQWL